MLRTTLSLTNGQALVEAGRCLGCYQAPCAAACPAGVDVPGFIRRFREGNLSGAAELIYQACPLGRTCGAACPTTELCEGACVLPGLGQSPVRIGALQAHITESCPGAEPQPLTGGGLPVAVIGAGPAGLGCAVQLNRLGYRVEIFDRRPQAGGLVSRVIPAHRLPQAAVAVDLQRIQASAIQFHPGVTVDEALANRILLDFSAVFIGTGQGEELSTGLPAFSGQGVFSALQLLEQARSGEPLQLGRRVAVIGGGNVALDAAVVARRAGAEQVFVLYRRGKDEMPAWESEYLEACTLGVEFRWLSVVQEILGQDGRVRAVRVGRMRYSAQVQGGRRGVEPDPDQAEFSQACDSVVLAAGQRADLRAALAFGALPGGGLLAVQPGTHRTANPKVFAAGEAVLGGTTIVASLSSGMAAGAEIHAFLQEGTKNG